MVTIRIPYTDPLPVSRIIPTNANTVGGAVNALVQFLASGKGETVLLTGAGISVAVCRQPLISLSPYAINQVPSNQGVYIGII
jgi:hypothetical protein